MHFSRIKGPSLARSATGPISKGAQVALLVCGLLGIASALLVSSGTIASANGSASNPGEPSGRQAGRKAPPGMVLIAGGMFMMGTNDKESFPNERPAHLVQVKGFWMDEHDVTNAEFAKFVEVTGYLSAWWRWVPGANWRYPEWPGSSIQGRENYPVVQVSWYDAVAYAQWAGKRLPTEAEWEFAARGGLESKRYVWGDDFRPGGRYMANTWQGVFPVRDTGEDGFVGTSPVGSFPANGYGLYDMAGNVWQWCSDWYRVDAHVEAASQNVCRDPAGPAGSYDPGDPYSPKRVVKGGSFLCNPSYCESYRPSARRGTPPDTGSSHTGFRCVISGDDTLVSRSTGNQPSLTNETASSPSKPN
ncbi:MAG: formylglycine-generating enzyme family protein [Verrucomicrobia bacterium]|nr:formylglycine-generating enzyme family protein [Verrucomicrobiota bacterium]